MLKKSGFTPKPYEEVIRIAVLKQLEKLEAVKQAPKAPKTPLKRSKGKKTVKGAPKSISKLKKDLWKLFSLFIRTRDKFTCVTCGKQATGSGMHAGHFITGATCTAKLYFDETNVHAQCYHCNINLSGNWVKYEQFMVSKHGQKHVDELKARRTLEMGNKVDSLWYIMLINYYKKKLSTP